MAKRPSPAQMRARRLFAARFGKKRAPKTKRPSRARRAVARVRKAFRSRRSGMNLRRIGSHPAVSGALAGAAANFAGSVSPTYGPGVALVGVGVVMKNPTLQTLGGVALGSALVGTTGIPGSATPARGVL